MAEPIRIAHVIGNVVKGGVESVVYNYYRFMDRSEIQFDFIVHDNSPYEIPDEIMALGCRVYKVPHYKYLPAYIKALKHLFTQGSWHIVHSHMSTLSVFTLYAAKRAGVPVRIAHSHGVTRHNKDEIVKNIFRHTLRTLARAYPTHFLACAEYSGAWMFGKRMQKERKITLISNAIDHKAFAFDEGIRRRVRNDLGVDGNYVIGHVGRFMTQKNHGFLIDVFAEVYKRDNDSILVLVGDGELRGKIEERVECLNLKESVCFLGGREDVNELYQAMDVFVLPSLYEGLPVALVEAQFAGLPAVVSDEVTEEAKFTNLIEFMSLREDAGRWAERVLDKRGMGRIDVSEEPRAKMFTINDNAEKLKRIYFEFFNRSNYARKAIDGSIVS